MDWTHLATPLWVSSVKKILAINATQIQIVTRKADGWHTASASGDPAAASGTKLYIFFLFFFFYWTSTGNTKKSSLTFQQPKISITPSTQIIKKLFEAPYNGSYKLLGHNHKYFILLLDDVQNNISIDKLVVILVMSD